MTAFAAFVLLLAQTGLAEPPPGCTGPVCQVAMPPPEASPFADPELEIARGRLRLDVMRRGQAAFAFETALANAVQAARGKPLGAPEWVHARRVLQGAAQASADLAASEIGIQGFLAKAAGRRAPDIAEAEATARALRATLQGDARRFAAAVKAFAETEGSAPQR